MKNAIFKYDQRMGESILWMLGDCQFLCDEKKDDRGRETLYFLIR